MKSRALLGLLIVACGAFVTSAAAQKPTRCSLSSDRMRIDSTAVGSVGFAGGGVVIRCPERGVTLRGDSAERFPDHDMMIGHAVFDDPRLHATSQYMTQYPADDRILAVGDVHARLANGSTLDGPIAEWRRIIPKVRPRQQILATSRPTINIVEKDSTGKPQPPTTVVAERVFMDGDSLVYGSGQVVITRPEITASADSVSIDQGKETMRLERQPQLIGKKDRQFTLKGDVIDLYSKNRKLIRVVSRANAVAVSDSMTITSDTIDLRMSDDLLQHAYAWGKKSRARAQSPSQDMLADSLDVTMPRSKVQLVRAVKNAFAQGKPDSTRFHVEKTDSTDWIRGDTIVAHFDTLAQRDTSKTPNIQLLVANGHASSLYHLAPSDSAERRAAINYVNARTININFDKQRVATVTAVDSVSGVYIEPTADSTARTAAAGAKAKAPASAKPAGAATSTPSTRPPASKPPAKPPAESSTPLAAKRP